MKLAGLVRMEGRQPGITIADAIQEIARSDLPRLPRTAAWLIGLGYSGRKRKENAVSDSGGRGARK